MRAGTVHTLFTLIALAVVTLGCGGESQPIAEEPAPQPTERDPDAAFEEWRKNNMLPRDEILEDIRRMVEEERRPR